MFSHGVRLISARGISCGRLGAWGQRPPGDGVPDEKSKGNSPGHAQGIRYPTGPAPGPKFGPAGFCTVNKMPPLRPGCNRRGWTRTGRRLAAVRCQRSGTDGSNKRGQTSAEVPDHVTVMGRPPSSPPLPDRCPRLVMSFFA